MKFVIILLVIIVLIALWIIKKYNTLVVLRNKVRNQWSQIDVQLKKRFDLIPNLVETVKGYASHEKETLDAVIEARSSALNAKTPNEEIDANKVLSGALTKLFALSEAYPELKADSNFRELQQTLNDVEEKIAYSRQFYNDTVLKYQNAIEAFPTSIIAKMFGFEKQNFFEATKEEKENVQVKF